MTFFDAGLASGYVLRLDVWQNGQNIAGNYSNVAWNLKIIKGAGSGKYAGGPHSWSINIGGYTASGSFGSYDFRNYSELVLSTGSVDRGHNADGTLSIYCGSSYDDNNTYGELGDGGASGNMGLTTIPRATTATFTNPMVAGTAYTVNLPRASTAFTHIVDLYFGTISGQRMATNATTSFSWTPDLTLLNQMPTTANGTGFMRVNTYNGGTLIGYKDQSLTIQAPASVVPTFTTVTATEATAGIAANIGGFVQGISKLALAITGAAGAYSSTISSYKIAVAGQTINAISGTTLAAIASTGTVAIVATITDSRGRTATKTVNVTVLAYTPPMITAITAKRALVGGTLNDNGTYIRVDINAAVQSLVVSTVQKNTLIYKISTKAYGATVWTLKSTTTPGGVVFNSYALVSPYPIENSFDVLVEISDDFSTSAQQLTVATASIFQHWDAALGVGIGKYRQNGMLDVLGKIFQNNGVEIEPAGNIVITARTTAPTGWLLCQGQVVSRTTYATLFAAIGTTYGAGDGSTTFGVPNLKGRVIVGVDTSQTEFDVLGETGGAKTHTLSLSEMPAHDHTINLRRGGSAADSGGAGGYLWHNVTVDPREVTTTRGAGAAHNNLQPYAAMHYIIKT